jgi:nicotinamide riboside transporter PnuC
VLLFLEISSVVCVLAYLYLVSKQNANAWLFGGLASLLSLIFFYLQHLYASAFLNCIYAFQALIGYKIWRQVNQAKQPTYQWSWKPHFIALLVFILMGVLLNNSQALLTWSSEQNLWYFNTLYLDILIGTLGVWATFLEIRKDLSCWWYWITSNLAYAVLYSIQCFQGAPMYAYTVLMYFLFGFSVYAQNQWTKSTKTKVI